MSGITIWPSVTEDTGVEAGTSVTTWMHVSSGGTSSAPGLLLLMTGSDLLLMNGNLLSLV